MIIAIGCDHIVTDTKIALSDHLKLDGHEVIDVGTYDYTRTHYPIFGARVARLVVDGGARFGVVICGTGVGITVAANKNYGIRAALVRDVSSARYARRVLDANVLGLGGKIVGLNLLFEIVDAFVSTDYVPNVESERLIKKIDALVPLGNLNSDSVFKEEIRRWDQGFYHD